MTTIIWQKKKRAIRLIHFLFTISLFLFALLLFLYSSEIKKTIQSTLIIAYKSLIPTLFPFMILSGVSMHVLCQGDEKKQGDPRNTKRLSHYLLLASAMVFGFPIGAKIVSDLYNENKITIEETNRYLPLLNQTSLPFVTLVVGHDFLSSSALGLMLYTCMLLSAFIVFLYKREKRKDTILPKKPSVTRDFSLVSCIRSATQNMLYIVGFLVAFSIPTALAKACFGGVFSVLISMVLELSSGCCAIVEYFSSASLFRIPLLCFCISFGGFCVGAQSKMCIGEAPFSMREYYIRKFFQGIIAFCLGFFIQFLPIAK